MRSTVGERSYWKHYMSQDVSDGTISHRLGSAGPATSQLHLFTFMRKDVRHYCTCVIGVKCMFVCVYVIHLHAKVGRASDIAHRHRYISVRHVYTRQLLLGEASGVEVDAFVRP